MKKMTREDAKKYIDDVYDALETDTLQVATINHAANISINEKFICCSAAGSKKMADEAKTIILFHKGIFNQMSFYSCYQNPCNIQAMGTEKRMLIPKIPKIPKYRE